MSDMLAALSWERSRDIRAAWAVTTSGKGETGRMSGKIGMGAPLLGANLDGCQVILFSAFALGSGRMAGIGESRPCETFDGSIGALSRVDPPINDFLNHDDGFEVSVG